MASLTADSKYNELVGGDHTLASEPAASGTYYRGQFVKWDASAGRVTQADHAVAAAAGDVVVGIVDDQQVIAADDDRLSFKKGLVAMTVSPVVAVNALCYLSSQTAVTGTAGTLLTAGRYLGTANDVRTTTNAGIVNVGFEVSGSTV